MGSKGFRGSDECGMVRPSRDLFRPRLRLVQGRYGKKALFWAWPLSIFAFIVSLVACGSERPDFEGATFLNTDAQAPGGTTKVRDVTMKTDGVPVIEPSNIPVSEPAGRKIRFRMKLTIQVASGTPSFLYRSRNWVIVFSKPGGSSPRTFRSSTTEAENQLRIVTDGFAGDKTEATITEAQTQPVEFEIELKEGEWDIVRALAESTPDTQRRFIQVQAVYTDKETIPARGSDSDGTIYVDESVKMQNDEGLIAAAASVRVAGTSSGAVTLEFGEPASTAAILPASDYKEIGNSILSGYLVMYWKDSDCENSPWVLQSNSQFRQDRDLADPSLSCSYPGLSSMVEASDGSQTRCPFGCGFEASQSYFTGARNPTDEDVAIPLETGGNCYRVARVPAGRSSFSISGLDNNESYGFAVWPLDNAGTPGEKRSACVQAVPLKVPLASANDASETVRDCFIASAASGSPSSLTVHYWRILRDRYLDPWGLSPIYYRYAPALAHWLESHPDFKKPINFVLLASGETIVQMSDWWSEWMSALGELLSRFGNQLSSEARAADASQEDPVPSKALPDQPLDSDQGEEAPTKKLSESPSESVDDDAPRKKSLPEVNQEQNDAEQGQKALPAVAIPSDTSAPEPRYPEGSSSGFFRLGGGMFQPDESEAWETFYKVGDPYQIFVSQSFRLLDLMGELSLGMAVTYQAHSGRVPERLADGTTVNPLLVSRKIGFYSVGLSALSEYRWRYVPYPPVAPRIFAAYGGERLRETSREDSAFSSSDSEEGKSGTPGYTLLKTFVLVGGGLDFSMGGIFGSRYQGLSLGYGAKDILLSFDAGQKFDLSDHKFAQNGLSLMGSFALAFE